MLRSASRTLSPCRASVVTSGLWRRLKWEGKYRPPVVAVALARRAVLGRADLAVGERLGWRLSPPGLRRKLALEPVKQRRRTGYRAGRGRLVTGDTGTLAKQRARAGSQRMQPGGVEHLLAVRRPLRDRGLRTAQAIAREPRRATIRASHRSGPDTRRQASISAVSSRSSASRARRSLSSWPAAA